MTVWGGRWVKRGRSDGGEGRDGMARDQTRFGCCERSSMERLFFVASSRWEGIPAVKACHGHLVGRLWTQAWTIGVAVELRIEKVDEDSMTSSKRIPKSF